MSEHHEKPHHQTEDYHPLGRKILPLGTRRGGIFVFWLVVAVAAGLVGADFITRLLDDAPHKGFAGWYGLYGFVMAVFLVMSARLLRLFLRRPENYYDDLLERPPLIEPMRSDWSQHDDEEQP